MADIRLFNFIMMIDFFSFTNFVSEYCDKVRIRFQISHFSHLCTFSTSFHFQLLKFFFSTYNWATIFRPRVWEKTDEIIKIHTWCQYIVAGSGLLEPLKTSSIDQYYYFCSYKKQTVVQNKMFTILLRSRQWTNNECQHKIKLSFVLAGLKWR